MQSENVNEVTKQAWVDVDVAEMKAFIAMFILMGLSRRRSYKIHWRTHWLLAVPGMQTVMARDRFLLILRFLYLTNNADVVERGRAGYDRASKIRPMIRHLVTAWQAAYNIEQSISVDELMIAFKGRVSMRQYLPKKPTKWGLKGWVMAGSGSGFVYNWMLYTGKEDGAVAVGLRQRVVMSLTDCLPASHTVNYDNFFLSVKLMTSLRRRGIGSCGTIRANRRGLPAQLKAFAKQKAALQRMSPLFLRSGDMLAIGWFDKRPVCLLTNVQSSELAVKQRRDRAGVDGHAQVLKPAAIEAYNQKMGGVDRSDQLNSYYALMNRSMKWWKKVFFHLLLTAVLHRSCTSCTGRLLS